MKSAVRTIKARYLLLWLLTATMLSGLVLIVAGWPGDTSDPEVQWARPLS